MRRGLGVLGVLALLALVALLVPAPAALGAGPAAKSSSTVPTGNVSGPALVATGSNGTFYFNASGGPGDENGTFSGSIRWNATLSGTNTTGSAVSPKNGTITSKTSQPVQLIVATGVIAQSMTLTVTLTSIAGTKNASANITRTFRVVVPYVLRATLVAGPSSAVLPFNVTVALDGTVVASIPIPKLAPNGTYLLQYRYASTGLSSGYHTFTLTVENVHGLVTFANGATVQATTFYVAPGATNYTLWYVAGFVAFFGVLFIYATRAGARRRGVARR